MKERVLKLRFGVLIIFVCMGLCQFAPGQSDNLVSKGIGDIKSADPYIWAFDQDYLSFSRINFFPESPRIYSSVRKDNPFFPLGAWRSALIGFGNRESRDTLVRNEIISVLNETGIDDIFSLKFKGTFGLALGVTGNNIVVLDSLVLGAFGNGGFAVLRLKESGQKITAASDSIVFHILGVSDSIFPNLVCISGEVCDLEPVRTVSHELDSVISVDLIAADKYGQDSILVFLASGEKDGNGELRRGWLGSGKFNKVSFGGNAKPVIREIMVNPHNHLIWGFTTNRIYVSTDRGISFHRPGNPVSIPDRLIQNLNKPKLAFYGDTTFISFGFPSYPGIVTFVGDSMITDSQSKSSEYFFYLENELSSKLGNQNNITGLAVVNDGVRSILAAGTDEQGVYYRYIDEISWKNLNRLKKISGDLEEVITFPTIFDGSAPVRLGYQLKEDGKVTITVFNYAMEKVRTIVENSPRRGGSARSEDPEQDRWNGKDDNRRHVSAGMYYILVESDKGSKGWGKVMSVYGRK